MQPSNSDFKHSEIMRRILGALNGDIEKAAAVYAALEDVGLLPRKSNEDDWPALKYARSFAHNEIRKHSHLIS
jgi:hypothetical protein